MLRLSSLRPLPITIAALAVLLVCKSINLVHAAAALLADTAREVPSHDKPAASPTGAATLPSHAASELPTAPQPSPDPTPPASAGSPTHPATADDKDLAEELARQQAALDLRLRDNAANEDLIATVRTRLQQEMAALDERRKAVEAAEQQRTEQDEATWSKLAKLYEDMPPRSAAGVFNVIDAHVLLRIVERMNVRKASSVVAAMDPERARLVTQLLAAQKLPSASSAVGSREAERDSLAAVASSADKN